MPRPFPLYRGSSTTGNTHIDEESSATNTIEERSIPNSPLIKERKHPHSSPQRSLSVCACEISENPTDSDSIPLPSPPNSSERVPLPKFAMFSFLSILVFLSVLSSTSSNYGLNSFPNKLVFPRSYIRLRQELLLEFSNGGIFRLGTIRPKELGICPKHMEDIVPCYNGSGSLELDERQCRVFSGASKCLIRPPKEYRTPPRWPTCRDSVWSGNVKAAKNLTVSAIGARVKRLMLVEGKVITFQSDGTQSYSQLIAKMIGLKSDAHFRRSGVRMVLDIGCGFGSLGAHMFTRKVKALCVAQYEAHGSHVQFALERGLPAMIGTFATRRLPYPSLSFDMVHCADCGVDWSMKDGVLLMEVDRLLRPGGFFVWTSNLHETISSTKDQNKRTEVEGLAKGMCWDLISRQEQTIIWKKKNEHSCYLRRRSNALPSLCDMEVQKESSWNQPLHSCIVGVPSARWVSARQQTLWPHVLALPSSRLLNQGFLSEELTEDSNTWLSLVRSYWTLFSPIIFSDHPKRPAEGDPLPPPNMVRNVMDMNALYGGFNAALLQAGKLIWVMNVVPTTGPNTLPAIFSRGLIATLHDWCEAFPTYPRTYDLLHGIGLLSQEMERPDGCGLSSLFLEMDRILRPKGWVLLRDKAQVIEDARMAAVQMRWEARIVEVESDNELRLLVCQKSFLKS